MGDNTNGGNVRKKDKFKMGDIAKNVVEFQHGGYWIIEWGILNVHRFSVV